MGFTRLLEKKPLCNEYLLAYQLTCSLLAGLLFLVERPASPMEETPWRWVGLLIVASFGAWIGFAYSTFRARASLELGLVSIVSKTKIIWSALLGASVFDERLAWLQLATPSKIGLPTTVMRGSRRFFSPWRSGLIRL
ncbi:EamA family transporter [Vibrio antiquarius]|uniref:EamA family transporter n=1 Tax=Vibrio antiquarius (strain Ex25) TaxID=150340 RepID=UPI0026589F96|nr:hypothetical protein [Vibrio antiquarius]MCR9964042.1 hypothetical protein [Vibrio antiquarius]